MALVPSRANNASLTLCVLLHLALVAYATPQHSRNKIDLSVGLVNEEERGHSQGNVAAAIARDSGSDDKRGFSPWGGKRDAEAEKRAFSPWGGKRAFSPWGGKRALMVSFNPWGGKRSLENEHVNTFSDSKTSSTSNVASKRFINTGDRAGKKVFYNLIRLPWTRQTRPGASWLSKRNAGLNKENENKFLEKKAFNPWGGKRALQMYVDPVKKAFAPWGGKRSDYNAIGEDMKAFSPWGGKRAFAPWGGKRSEEDYHQEKKAFSPWGGKRAEIEADKKRAFTPWGGKRISEISEEERRVGFVPWGGKRTGESEDKAHKRAFTPWGGKRAFAPWGGKRALDDKVKRAFAPWGGKRSPEYVDDVIKRVFIHSHGEGETITDKRTSDNEIEKDKRGFSPWGGKRSDEPAADDKRDSFRPWGGKRSD